MEIADGRIFIVVLFSDWCSLFLDHDAESLSNLPRIQGQKDGCFKLNIRTKNKQYSGQGHSRPKSVIKFISFDKYKMTTYIILHSLFHFV